MSKIILYGGSFDPFHKAHEEVVKFLTNKFPTEEIWVLPSYNWMKPSGLFSIEERIFMAKEVLKKYSSVKVLDWSLFEDTTSSFLMANKIKALGHELKIALGEDNLKTILNWKNASNLISDNNFILLSRSNYNLIKNPPSAAIAQLINKSSVFDFDSNFKDISSSLIRENPIKFIDYIPEEISQIFKNKMELE